MTNQNAADLALAAWQRAKGTRSFRQAVPHYLEAYRYAKAVK